MVLPFLIFCTTLSLKIHITLSKSVGDSSDLPDFLNDTDVTSSSLESSTHIPSSTMNPSSRPRPVIGMDLHCPSIENAVSTCPKGMLLFKLQCLKVTRLLG
ncbi:hypothetical protein B9Z55_006136 [Caenorhabditis nigoni]|uniref:Secreted protein n=1 Tax=Caenorhabditis nigoni TaxID=1611254 RepID=A0A2G5V3S9_9PELO|nr:hypothetical protein B9Z55_006136 [Caenorhabditis nigoni]